MKHLVVVDMQNDFCTGSLANPDAVAVIPFIRQKIAEFRKDGKKNIIYTRDTHGEDYLETLEGKHLPVRHCIKGSEGWEIVQELSPENDDMVIDKPTFGYTGWRDIPRISDGDEIYMCGVCTDICVSSNALALKAAYPKSEVFIYKDGCAGLTKEKHEHALDVMASCQCNVI